MRLGNLKIGVRLGTCFGILICLAGLIGYFAVGNVTTLSGLTNKLYKHPYAVSTATLRIDADIVRMHRSMKDVALARDEAGIDAAAVTVAEFEKRIYADFDIIAERFLGDQKQVNDTRKLFTDWKPIRDEVIDLMRAGDRQTAADITVGKGAKHVQALNQAIVNFLNFAQGKADAFVKNADHSREKALFISYLIVGLVFVIGVILSFVMTRSITGPMKEALRVANAMAANDLTATVSTNRRDETGQMLTAMGTMVENLSTTISANAAAAESVSSAASQQASSLEETSSSLEEMSSMTKQNADHANQANSIVAKTQKDMNVANGSMGKLISSMEEISTASEETQKIVKTIDEIAFQTNLLALNAAVEAARAGEVGAGFAVVADEVRNLAMRAADAAKNTADLIEGTVKKINDGSGLVAKTNEAFAEVASGAGKVGGLVSEIAAASQEQAEGIEQVNKAVAEMDKAVQENAASAEEMASSMAMFKVNDAMPHRNAQTASRPIAVPARRNSNARQIASGKDREVSPDQLIPLEEGELSDF